MTSLPPLATGKAQNLSSQVNAQELVATFLAGFSQNTKNAYECDLKHFAAYLGVDLDQAASQLLGLGAGQANYLVLQYRTYLLELGLAPKSINRRLASLRSLVKLGRILGLMSWSLEVPSVKTENYRDTAGPDLPAVRAMLANIEARQDAKGTRDAAIYRLLFDTALRRGEVITLDLEHLDLERSLVWVQGKGKSQRQTITLPPATRAALDAWVALRGKHSGPLFHNFDRAGKGAGRLTGRSVGHIVTRLGQDIGIKARPHGLRHASITIALERTHGDVAKVQGFARHANPATTMIYNDHRQNAAGAVACLVAMEL